MAVSMLGILGMLLALLMALSMLGMLLLLAMLLLRSALLAMLLLSLIWLAAMPPMLVDWLSSCTAGSSLGSFL